MLLQGNSNAAATVRVQHRHGSGVQEEALLQSEVTQKSANAFSVDLSNAHEVARGHHVPNQRRLVGERMVETPTQD